MKVVRFTKDEPDDIRMFAIYIATLTKEGVEYTITETMKTFEVEVVGF